MDQDLELLDYHQVSAVTGLKVHQLTYLVREGKGPPSLVIGERMRRFRRCDVRSWLEACRQPSAA